MGSRARIAVFGIIGFEPASEHLWRPLSEPGLAAAITTNMIVDSYVAVWRDGTNVRIFQVTP